MKVYIISAPYSDRFEQVLGYVVRDAIDERPVAVALGDSPETPQRALDAGHRASARGETAHIGRRYR